MLRHEPNYLAVRKIQFTAVGLLSLILISGLFLISYQNGMMKNYHSLSLPAVPSKSPRGQIEFESGVYALRLRTDQLRNLESYQIPEVREPWAQVPINRAIEVMVQKNSTEPRILFGTTGGAK
jgi:hypothetical protein